MREVFDFRIPEERARGHLPDSAGELLGDSVQRVLVSSDDPLFDQIGRLEREARARGEYFHSGWQPRRSYTRNELLAADLFQAWPRVTFEPAGEECGTEYDESRACSECGAGAPQATPLFLRARRIPRRVDFARTIAGELVVSARARSVFLDEELVGVEFDPVRLSDEGGIPSSDYFQWRVVGPPVAMHSATRTGDGPFGEPGYGRCPLGDVAGLNLVSEVHVERGSLTSADVMLTWQRIGCRLGLLRPEPVLLLSPRARRAIEEKELLGLSIEIARVT